MHISAYVNLLHEIVERQGQRFLCCFRELGGEGRVVCSHNTSDVFVTSTSVEERPAKQVLVFTTRPPDAIAPGETAVVKLALLDELGAPVRGEPVEMMLLAPPGSGRLAKGSTVVTTDAHGAASFTLQFDRHSHSAGYGLLFGTAKSFGAGSLPNLLEALKRALLRVYRRLQATALAGLEQLSTVASDVLGPQAGALARGLALSPEVRAILGDAVNVSAGNRGGVCSWSITGVANPIRETANNGAATTMPNTP